MPFGLWKLVSTYTGSVDLGMIGELSINQSINQPTNQPISLFQVGTRSTITVKRTHMQITATTTTRTTTKNFMLNLILYITTAHTLG